MSVYWNSGVILWQDHAPNPTEHYSLSHLHPFAQLIELAPTGRHPTLTVKLHVSFGLHTFTRAIELGDGRHQFYRDNRETRTFCPTRYTRPLELPEIIRTLKTRRCEFARGMSGPVNYVTVETTDGER